MSTSDELSNFELLLQILLVPAQDLENTMVAVRDESVDTAVGVNLENKYGKVVGLRRSASPLFATDDDTYRRGIRAQIQTNDSIGQREQLIRIAQLIVDDDTTTIAIRRDGTATLNVQVMDAAVLSATETLLVDFLTRAVSNGVRVVVTSFPTGPVFLMGIGILDNTQSPGTGSLLADTRSIDS